MRIGIDVMGGDFAPDAVIEGAADALARIPVSEKLVLIGDNDEYEINSLQWESIPPNLKLYLQPK
ncbi:MAG TPA: hypothetical protein PKI12_09120 [Bacteroidales bacterium]|nr:hypothetical protein [Bacteroidales bacterium]